MKELADAILKLDWQDMDTFAQRIIEIATDDEGEPNNERYISQCLIDFANELSESCAELAKGEQP